MDTLESRRIIMPGRRQPGHWSMLRRRHSQRGSAAVGFALVMVPLITLLLGTIQFGWYFYTAQSASSGAREAARRLSVGDCQTGAQAQTYAAGQANVINFGLTFGTPGATDRTVTNPGALPAI